MLDNLFSALDALGSEDDEGAAIVGVARHGSDVTLTVHLGFLYTPGAVEWWTVYTPGSVETWSVECRDVEDYRVGCDPLDAPVELLDDAPELWPYLHPSARLYCVGVAPEQTDAALGALYRVYRTAVGDAHDSLLFGRGLNAMTAFAGGSGLVAEGPIPLLKVYEAALSSLGITTSILDERMPMPRQGADPESGLPRLLVIGASWVVARSFEATRLDVTPDPPEAT